MEGTYYFSLVLPPQQTGNGGREGHYLGSCDEFRSYDRLRFVSKIPVCIIFIWNMLWKICMNIDGCTGKHSESFWVCFLTFQTYQHTHRVVYLLRPLVVYGHLKWCATLLAVTYIINPHMLTCCVLPGQWGWAILGLIWKRKLVFSNLKCKLLSFFPFSSVIMAE